MTPPKNRVRDGLRNGDIIVRGDHWPLLLYRNYVCDPEDMWNGLLRSDILVYVRCFLFILPPRKLRHSDFTDF